jgi:PrcB C-terminal
VVLAIAGGAVWTQVYETGGTKQLAWQDVTAEVSGQALWPKSVTRSFWRQRQVDRYLGRIFPRRRPLFPRIDFTRKRLVLVAAGPRSSTGYRVEILSATERRGAIRIVAREVTPRLADRVQARLTSPFRLITIPTTGKRVYVQWQGRP